MTKKLIKIWGVLKVNKKYDHANTRILFTFVIKKDDLESQCVLEYKIQLTNKFTIQVNDTFPQLYYVQKI